MQSKIKFISCVSRKSILTKKQVFYCLFETLPQDLITPQSYWSKGIFPWYSSLKADMEITGQKQSEYNPVV